MMAEQHPIDELLIHVVIADAKKRNYQGNLTITGVTAIEIPLKDKVSKLIIRSSSNVRGKPWVDWVLIEWPKEEFSTGALPANRYCIARVHGFVRYDVNDYPTFRKRHDRMDMSKRDSNLYMVLDTSAGYIDKHKLAMDMIVPFELKDSDKGLRIFPLECIRQGLAVVTDFKSKTSSRFIAISPRCTWGLLFRSRIRHLWENRQSGEDGSSDKDDSS